MPKFKVEVTQTFRIPRWTTVTVDAESAAQWLS